MNSSIVDYIGLAERLRAGAEWIGKHGRGTITGLKGELEEAADALEKASAMEEMLEAAKRDMTRTCTNCAKKDGCPNRYVGIEQPSGKYSIKQCWKWRGEK